MSDHFEEAGYGGRAIGFGERPAIVTVDFQLGFTSPEWPSGRSPHIQRAVERTRELLVLARELRLPVASCNVAWGSERDMGRWKVDSLYQGAFFYGHPATRLDPRIYEPGYDFHFTKGAPSIFFGTPLVTFLTKQAVDTVIVCGCTTSGCVRASIIDSFSYGYRTIVPEECCGDQEEQPHRDNLRDVHRRYADVMPLAEVMARLRGAPAAR
ncbi:MAG: isochorismatase family protein [Proteobacteria bacterium]|nr:isochorismatase family protein [Pseudomonadota bacterium]